MHIRRLAVLVVLVFVLASPSLLLAQDAPAAPAAPAGPPPPPPRLEGSGQFSYVATTGNSDTQSLGLGGEVFYRPLPWIFQAKAAFIRLESDNEVTAKSLVLLFRGSRDLTPRVALYSEYDYLHDTFAGIEGRNAITGGVDFKVINTEQQKLRLSAGVGYAHESHVIGEDESEGTLTQAVSYSLKLSKTAELTEDFDVDESLARSDNWRLGNQVALSAAITRILSLKVSHVIRYVNDPVPGFETTDTITSVAFVAKF